MCPAVCPDLLGFREKVQEYNKSKEMWFIGVINKSNKGVCSKRYNESV